MHATTAHHLRELDHRCSDGIDVHLLWDPRDDLLLVVVIDSRTCASFTVEVTDHARAQQVFHHPFAHATQVHTDRVMPGHTGATEAAAS
jgi:hypothetical protein